jgi:hypothetical protein
MEWIGGGGVKEFRAMRDGYTGFKPDKGYRLKGRSQQRGEH